MDDRERRRYEKLIWELEEKNTVLLERLNKKIQFSKVVCIIAIVAVFMVLWMNFFLAWHEKPTLSDEALKVIVIFGGFAVNGYFVLNGARDWMKDKYSVDENGIPFETQNDMDDNSG